MFDQLKNRFTVGLNYSHHFIDTTFLMYVDETFANGQKYYLERLPLVIGMDHAGVSVRPNTIELPATTDYRRDCSNGVYRASLAGLFALSFMIHVLDEGEIFLLGFDYGAKKGKGLQGRAYDKHGHALTHWYQYGDISSIYTGQKQEIRHRGIGKINWYEATDKDEKSQQRISRAEHEFQVYSSERKVSIYNVSMESAIPTFPEVSYEQFFQMLDDLDYDQEALRTEVAQKAVALRKKLVT
ncbi:MAG: hypothetical protein JW902_07730 [Syntrophaceae bacterium]|nr:hypothetical protein [Syntrophaceae bacterium]